MKRSILISLVLAAAVSCTACGKVEGVKTEMPAVTTAVTTAPQTEATTAADEINEAPAVTTKEAAQEPTETTEAEAPAETVTTTAEAAAAGGEAPQPAATQQQAQPKPQRPAGTAPSAGDSDYAPAPKQYDIEGITYIQGTLIANKSYSLPSTFNPGLDPTCENQFYKLTNDAAKEGLNIWFASGFRSYDYQAQIYNNYVDLDGQALADTYSARPGYSEHQSGLAIDVNSINDSFIGTPEAIWLENHCHEYGFILRYPRGKESITGYQYESWHIRYVGTDLSYAIHDSGLTLEEYFGIDSYYHE